MSRHRHKQRSKLIVVHRKQLSDAAEEITGRLRVVFCRLIDEHGRRLRECIPDSGGIRA